MNARPRRPFFRSLRNQPVFRRALLQRRDQSIFFSSSYTNWTCVDLTPATIEANKRFFDGNEDLVPKQAYTMGIKTIMQARKVLVVANGLAKAKAVKAVVSGPVTPECPGSILQMHPDCTLVADEEALSLL